MESSVPSPQGQEERQATETIEGIVYQAWRAVYAWLRLNRGEVLFLEHAEDFDVASAESVEGMQVKSKDGELSLGRAAARARDSDEYTKLLSLAILVTTAARDPYGVAANKAIASLAGVDAKPGNGIQEAARIIIESDKFEPLSSDSNFRNTLREVAGGNIDWGMPRASIQ